MGKIKVQIGTIGFLPFQINWSKVFNHKSKLFEVSKEIEKYHFKNGSDILYWGYSDSTLNEELPDSDVDLFIGITYVPLEDNYYIRRLENNRAVLSFYEVFEILKVNNIPLENLILKTIHIYTLAIRRGKGKLPTFEEIISFAHDDTRGCIFDMNGNKQDIVFSLNKPKLCEPCIDKLRKENISDNVLENTNESLSKIRKQRYYSISEFVKSRPILSIVISIIIGIIISLVATLIFEVFVKGYIK